MTCWQKNFENRRSLSQENNIKIDVNQSQHSTSQYTDTDLRN